MIYFSKKQKLRHLWIRSGWKHWMPLVISSIPYLGSIIWLLQRGQVWIAYILLAPLLMTAMLAILTLILARFEFRR